MQDDEIVCQCIDVWQIHRPTVDDLKFDRIHQTHDDFIVFRLTCHNLAFHCSWCIFLVTIYHYCDFHFPSLNNILNHDLPLFFFSHWMPCRLRTNSSAPNRLDNLPSFYILNIILNHLNLFVKIHHVPWETVGSDTNMLWLWPRFYELSESEIPESFIGCQARTRF